MGRNLSQTARTEFIAVQNVVTNIEEKVTMQTIHQQYLFAEIVEARYKQKVEEISVLCSVVMTVRSNTGDIHQKQNAHKFEIIAVLPSMQVGKNIPMNTSTQADRSLEQILSGGQMRQFFRNSNSIIKITPEVMRRMKQQKNTEKAVHMCMELMTNEINRRLKYDRVKDYFNYMDDVLKKDSDTIMKYFGDEIDKHIKEKSHQNYQIPEDKRQEQDDPESWDDCLEFPEDYEDDPINELLFGHHGVEYR